MDSDESDTLTQTTNLESIREVPEVDKRPSANIDFDIRETRKSISNF